MGVGDAPSGRDSDEGEGDLLPAVFLALLCWGCAGCVAAAVGLRG